MKKLFVGNLSWKATEDQLKELFETIAPVASVKIVIDQMTGKSKGFAFIEMEDADSAQAAIDKLNNAPLLDRNLRVSLAQERTERSGPREGGFRGGSDRGGADRGGADRGGADRGGERREFRSPRPSNGARTGGFRDSR